MAFEHPDYAEPDRAMHLEPEHRKRYIWFVTNVLNALDEILLSTNDQIWRETSNMVLAPHGHWLATAEFKSAELATYSDELRGIIAKVTKASA